MAYLWSRTVPCPNCDAQMPLIRQYWLARKDKKKVALKPVIDKDNNRVDFTIVEGPDVTGNPAEATTSRGDTRCLLCGQVSKGADVRRLAAEGKMNSFLTAVVLEGVDRGGKRYRLDSPHDMAAYQAASERLRVLRSEQLGDVPIIPDEPIDPDTLGLRVDSFGLNDWGKLFNDRQLLALTTFARLVGEAHAEMLRLGLNSEYATAVATYLGLAVDRLANQCNALSRWENASENLKGAFARQALPIVWDYAEAIPAGDYVGSWFSLLSGQLRVLGFGTLDAVVVSAEVPAVRQADATQLRSVAQAIVTDPPYYNAIDYAGLSDFFFVWLKRSVGFLHPELFAMPLTPKSRQAIMASETGEPAERRRYVDMMADAFRSMAHSLEPGGLTGVVFAHTDSDAWATLILDSPMGLRRGAC